MKRIDSGYGMKIFMKYDASDRQMEIARRMYPNALVVKSLEPEKVDTLSFKDSIDLLKLIRSQENSEKFENNIKLEIKKEKKLEINFENVKVTGDKLVSVA